MANFSLLAKIGLDTKAFQTGLKSADKQTGRFKKSLAKIGTIAAGAAAAAGAAFIALARSAIALGTRISDLGTQLNVGVEELQALRFAAQEAGASQGGLERALRNVQTRTQEAIKGNKSYSDAFETLGINIREFVNLPTEKKLEALAIAQSKATDAGAAYNAIARILGERAGPELQEVLQRLAKDGFGGVEDAARDAGQVMDKDVVQKMDEAADAIERFKTKMTIMAANVLTVMSRTVVPAFTIFKDTFGTLGDALASFSIKLSSFLNFLGGSISAVVEPANKAFQSLAMGIKAAALSAKLDFKGAGQAIKESTKLSKEAFNDLIAIPSKIAKEYDKANREMIAVNQIMEADQKDRVNNMKDAWDTLFNGVKTGSKEAAKAVAQGPAPVGETLASAAGRKASAISGRDVTFKATMDPDSMQTFFRAIVDGQRGKLFSESELQEKLAENGEVTNEKVVERLDTLIKVNEGQRVNEA